MSEPSPQAEFGGKARLFPLPNLVLFPHVLQPLHIFEPRYRAMTADALASDRLIAMVLPLPGHDEDPATPPALHCVACLGRIVADQQLADGRYNILLRGVARIRIVKEMATKTLYRVAKAEVLDEQPVEDECRARKWRKMLIDKAPGWFPEQGEIAEQFGRLFKSELSLGALCDIISFALPLAAEFKQVLLEELTVATRLQLLHDFLEGAKHASHACQRHFPPDFSAN